MSVVDGGKYGRGGLGNAARAEWTKLWSVRAPYLCLGAGALVTGVFGFYYGAIARLNDHPVQPVGNAATASVTLTQYAVVVLAMLMVTGEYVTGSMRTSLTWVPVRHRMQVAKAVVAGVTAFAAGLVYGVLGTAVAWPSFGGRATFGVGEAAWQVMGAGLYCALVAVLTVGVSFATRNAAGALSVLFVLLTAGPTICVGLGGPLLLAVNDYLPQTAGGAFMAVAGGVGWLAVVAGWAAVAHLAGRQVLRVRDA
ncbi:ABC transporter permease [Streptomyces sp. ME19-01-6]|uniref:ABC transporter permease n=1 Tax=Streptomyces sp. ME19-01-6 TaxID=3028686 RepID=UPI0029AD610D|nr:ABC transporter permease [Streptomyces sp. ME19-01-6]MDX3227365.1 ABC transporter permease [Streptomyces sp. ME19-01-6]